MCFPEKPPISFPPLVRASSSVHSDRIADLLADFDIEDVVTVEEKDGGKEAASSVPTQSNRGEKADAETERWWYFGDIVSIREFPRRPEILVGKLVQVYDRPESEWYFSPRSDRFPPVSGLKAPLPSLCNYRHSSSFWIKQ